MCFTVNVNIVREELEARYGSELIDHDKYRPSYYYHAYSLPSMPVVCSDRGAVIRLFRWGLIPSWVTDEGEANEIMLKTFNARSETISSKPAFRDSYASRRCLVPVCGFFEWQHHGGREIPWYITLKGETIFSLAGIWDSWSMKGGMTLNTFSVVTTRANELMEEIHNSKKRMPVILPASAERMWLSEGADERTLAALMEPVATDTLSAHTVSPLITNTRADRNRPELIMPFSYPVQGRLF
ncbi:MAG TPA: SOS response-associated peptidase [Bacteroidales bacterium]|jgi:putative SOS response-associated peptidase YedK|nr:SOS response-associated peptidase [Bacteroidales bacterium]